MDKFDKIIKEAVEGYEAPYDAQAWANVSNQLGSKGGAMRWIAGSAAGIALIVGGVYLSQQDETGKTPENLIADHNQKPVLVDQISTPETPDEISSGETSGTLTENPDENPVKQNESNASNTPSDSRNNLFVQGNSGNGIGNGGNGNTSGNSGGTGNHPDQNSGNPSSGQVQVHPHTGNTGNETAAGDQPVLNSRFSSENTTACQGETFVFTPDQPSDLPNAETPQALRPRSPTTLITSQVVRIGRRGRADLLPGPVKPRRNR